MAGSKLIYGIQQIGVGVTNAGDAFKWYGKNLGSNVLVFDDNNTATYMAPYMGGQPHEKRAILAINMQGGSGYELWQYTDRTPATAKSPIQAGDLGIFSVRVKSKDIHFSYNALKANGVTILSDLQKDPHGSTFFFVEDPNGNILQIVEYSSWYGNEKSHTGGICGCMIGVSDIEKAKKLYTDVLGYDKVIYDKTGIFEDFKDLPGGKEQFRRVLLEHSKDRIGGLSPLFGRSQLELIQVQSRTPVKIFADRYWGDIGFIHLCFDVRGMHALKKECAEKGFPFQVDSESSFQMGEAAGHWSYIEDPDGTLIEFVETHKIPIVKKWNWYFNLQKRDPLKPLPNWMINALAFNKVKL